MTMLPSTPVQEVDPSIRAACDDLYNQWHNGDLLFKQAVDQLAAIANTAAHVDQFANQGFAENTTGTMYGYRADLDESIRHFARARDLFERANNREMIVRAIMNLGECYRLKGDFPRARQFFSTAYRQATEYQFPQTQAFAAANEGHLLMAMNQPAPARERFEQAVAHAADITDESARITVLADSNQGLAACYLKQGQKGDAWRCALESLHLSRKSGQPFTMGLAYRTMGEVLTVLGYTPSGAPRFQRMQAPPETSDANDLAYIGAATNEHLGDADLYFQLSIEALQEIKAEGEIARTIYSQGLSLMARGQRMTASRKFQQAMLMFTKLGMRDDANKAAQAQMNALSR